MITFHLIYMVPPLGADLILFPALGISLPGLLHATPVIPSLPPLAKGPSPVPQEPSQTPLEVQLLQFHSSHFHLHRHPR